MKNNEAERLHEMLLSIYVEIKKICDENNLRYFAVGGTCIGAVRHNGIIPWDDDVDIAMPREDYEKFIEIAKEKLPSHLEVFDVTSCLHNENVFAKVHNVNTTCVGKDNVIYKDRYTGAFVDIMPLDGLPNNKFLRSIHMKKLKFLLIANTKVRFPYSRCSSFGGKLMYFLMWPVKKLRSPYYIYNKYLKLLKKYKFDESEYFCYAWDKYMKQFVFKKEWFDGSVTFKFNNTEIPCPIDYDSYMKKEFGNYMELPPIECRVMGHVEGGIMDLDNSYKKYLD